MSGPLLEIETSERVSVLTINRPDKRNAMSDALLAEFEAVFATPPEGTRVVIITGRGGHYCSGLDLSDHSQRDAEGAMHHSRRWQAVMDRIQFGGLPVISAMAGAVIGGGLELATATHVRIAEPDCVFQLPEGRRGIFTGGGAAVRVGRIIGADRMTEMMLTGRKYFTEDALRLGLAHYAVGHGEAMALAHELAAKIAANAPLSNFAMIQTLARVDDMSRADGHFVESLMTGLVQSTTDAEEGLAAFLEKRAPRFR